MKTSERDSMDTAPRNPTLHATGDLQDVRVAVVSDASPHRNGVGSYYRDLIGHMQSDLGCIKLVSPTRRSSGMYLISIPMPGDPSQRIRVPNVSVLSARLHQIRPSVIIIPCPGPFGLFALYFAMKYNIPLCVGLHTDYDKLTDLYWSGIFSHVSRGYLRATNRLLVRCSDLVMVANHDLHQTALDLGAKHVEIFGSVVPKRFLQKNICPHNGTCQRVFFAGRLAKEKNIATILEAAEALPQMEFQLAGDGPMRAEVERAAARHANVNYLGWLPRHKLMQALDESDMLILPSHLETFGTVALEAAARGRLVLVSAECGLLNWKAFHGNVLSILPEESLTQALVRVSELTPAERVQRSTDMRQATHAFNDQTVAAWEQVLLHLHALQQKGSHA